MKTHVLKGSKEEIAEGLAQIRGDVREAIIFVDERTPDSTAADISNTGDIFSEMQPLMVDIGGLDDSREAIYARMERE